MSFILKNNVQKCFNKLGSHLYYDFNLYLTYNHKEHLYEFHYPFNLSTEDYLFFLKNPVVKYIIPLCTPKQIQISERKPKSYFSLKKYSPYYILMFNKDASNYIQKSLNNPDTPNSYYILG